MNVGTDAGWIPANVSLNVRWSPRVGEAGGGRERDDIRFASRDRFAAFNGAAPIEVARLGELRAVALEHEIEAQLLLGRHEEAIPVLRQLIADHPLRERFRAQLMVALYRSGRQAEALRAFDATRERLVEELGVEPGAELQALQRSVLAHDLDLDWTPLGSPTGRAVASEGAGAEGAGLEGGSLPAPTSGLVGREREVVGVHAALAD